METKTELAASMRQVLAEAEHGNGGVDTADALAEMVLGVPALGVLMEVAAERRRQNEQWGEQDHPDGTGPGEWVLKGPGMVTQLSTAQGLARTFKHRTDARFAGGADRPGTWLDILLEEVFEASAEDDLVKLRTELIQVSAVAAQWAEAIDRRGGAEPMRYPRRCKWCQHVHDAAKVTVIDRYSDCSTYRCPGCQTLLDDRPEQWGGSSLPVGGKN